MLCENFEGAKSYMNSVLVNYLLIQQPNGLLHEDN